MNGLKTSVKVAGLSLIVLAAAGCASAKKGGPEAAPAPAPAPAAAAMGPETTAPANDSYTVVNGDSLWAISGKSDIYGDVYQWPLIYKANSGQIKDADLIYPGQELTINRGASEAEINAAINHAKTRGAWSIGVTEESDKAYLAN